MVFDFADEVQVVSLGGFWMAWDFGLPLAETVDDVGLPVFDVCGRWLGVWAVELADAV